MHGHDSGRTTVQTTVEAPTPHVRLIRIAGRLDRGAAARVLRLVDSQLDLIAARRLTVTDLVVDIDAVSSVDPVGLGCLRHAVYSTGRRGIGLHLSGCGGRVQLLPLRTQQLLAGFRRFPTAEVALRALGALADDRTPPPPARRSAATDPVGRPTTAGTRRRGSA